MSYLWKDPITKALQKKIQKIVQDKGFAFTINNPSQVIKEAGLSFFQDPLWKEALEDPEKALFVLKLIFQKINEGADSQPIKTANKLDALQTEFNGFLDPVPGSFIQRGLRNLAVDYDNGELLTTINSLGIKLSYLSEDLNEIEEASGG